MAYSATSKLSEVIERVSYVIETLSPSLAPSIAFRRHTDTACRLEHVTDPERFRLFEIKSENPTYGLTFSGVNIASLARVLKIRVGYPAADYHPEADDETIDNNRYLTEDLKSDDFRLIIRQLEAAHCFAEIDAEHPAIAGVELPLLTGERDENGGLVRTILYGVRFEERY